MPKIWVQTALLLFVHEAFRTHFLSGSSWNIYFSHSEPQRSNPRCVSFNGTVSERLKLYVLFQADAIAAQISQRRSQRQASAPRSSVEPVPASNVSHTPEQSSAQSQSQDDESLISPTTQSQIRDGPAGEAFTSQEGGCFAVAQCSLQATRVVCRLK